MNNLTKTHESLLNALVTDEKKYKNNFYSPGPYWNYKAKKILYWLKRKGLNQFRGLHSGVGTSYADNIVVDFRNELGAKGRFLALITRLPLLKKLYDLQVQSTIDITKETIRRKAIFYENNEKIKYLLSKYKILNSTEFGCVSKFKINGNEYSFHYLNLCERIDIISNKIDYKKIVSILEIGGGFGANIHLLLTNFNNIKKIIYLDIVPNLFVGTEYLRFFYKDAVKDYNFLKNKKNITFSDNNDLEILCIAPWQIENISCLIDHFHNAHSFQEMPKDVVKNYVKYILKIVKNNSVSLVAYGNDIKSNITLEISDLNVCFGNSLNIIKKHEIIDKNKKLYYLLPK